MTLFETYHAMNRPFWLILTLPQRLVFSPETVLSMVAELRSLKKQELPEPQDLVAAYTRETTIAGDLGRVEHECVVRRVCWPCLVELTTSAAPLPSIRKIFDDRNWLEPRCRRVLEKYTLPPSCVVVSPKNCASAVATVRSGGILSKATMASRILRATTPVYHLQA